MSTINLFYRSRFYNESAQNCKQVNLIVLIRVKVCLDGVLTYKYA